MGKSLAGFIKLIRFLSDKDVKVSKKMLFLIPILYLLFPFDLIGDFFPVAGQLDDIAVIVLMWPILKNLLNSYPENMDKTKKKDKGSIDIDKSDYEVK